MKLCIHRGTHQIGGVAAEISTASTRILIDMGDELSLDPNFVSAPLNIPGVTNGNGHCDAVLFTHYHGDHIGKITELPSDLPLYMGKIAKEIASQLANHLSVVSEEHQLMSERLKSVSTFNAGELFSFGEFNILPIVIDHSAFDAYAFSIEAKELKVFHTGDFRTHGFRSGKLPKVIDKYVKQNPAEKENKTLERFFDLLDVMDMEW